MSILETSIIITGPTTAGKTEIAKRLARKLNGAIINTDYFQLYANTHIHLGVGLGRDELPADIPCYLFGALSVKQPDPPFDAIVSLITQTAQKAITQGYVPIFIGCSFTLNSALVNNGITQNVFIPIWNKRDLLERCIKRIARMISDGLIEETQKIIDEGLCEHWVVSQNIIYQAVLSWIRNNEHDTHKLVTEISHIIVGGALEQRRKYKTLRNVTWLKNNSVDQVVDSILAKVLDKI